jgi:hypothetical protein
MTGVAGVEVGVHFEGVTARNKAGRGGGDARRCKADGCVGALGARQCAECHKLLLEDLNHFERVRPEP